MHTVRFSAVAMIVISGAMALAAQAPAGQRGGAPAGPPMTLTISGWSDGGTIPVKFSQAAAGVAVGEGTSPAMTWANAPGGDAVVLSSHA